MQFRRWATTVLKEYLIKGFAMDNERLKNPDGRPDYFDEMLARIRDIRASEKRFLPEGARTGCRYGVPWPNTGRGSASTPNRVAMNPAPVAAARSSRGAATRPRHRTEQAYPENTPLLD